MTWIKICGTTNLEDALMAVDAGADALGFVFYDGSPRNVNPEVVRDIVKKLPDKIEKVGVFAGESFEVMEELAIRAGLTAIQFLPSLSGDEDNMGRPRAAHLKKYLVIPARRFFDSKGALDFAISVKDPETEKWPTAIVVDSSTPQEPGGTGKTFDWQGSTPLVDIVRRAGFDMVVAGGLNPTNVAEAIRILNPWGVDVVSGVEASPGKKNPGKVRAFVKAVRQMEKSK